MSAENGRNAESRRTERRDLLLAGLVALGLMAMFVAVQRGKVSTYDSKIALATARAIADGHLHLTPADDHTGRNLPYSHYGIGMPLVILPLYLLQRALQVSPEMLTTLASPLLLAASGALLYLCGRELGWSRRVSLAAGLVFGALTQALQISQDLFSEPGVACGTALLMVGVLRWRAGRPSGPWLVGSGLGVGLLFRSDSAILLGVGLLLLPAVVPWRRLLAERRAWLGLVLPILPVLAWTAWYSLRRDGTLVPAVYGGTFTTPLLEGLHGLLLSHGRSLLVYNPFLLLAVPGAIALWRRDRAATALLVVLVVVRPLFFARWDAWGGGVNWGPRFLMPSVGPLSLLAVYAASRVGRLRAGLRVPAALVVAGLVVVGGVVSVASVWVWAGASWKWREYRPPGLEGQALREFSAERRNGYVYSVSNSAIAFNLRHLAHDNPDFPLNHFRGGADPIGLIGVAVALLVPLASWVLGRPPRGPRPRRTSPPPWGSRPRVAAGSQRQRDNGAESDPVAIELLRGPGRSAQVLAGSSRVGAPGDGRWPGTRPRPGPAGAESGQQPQHRQAERKPPWLGRTRVRSGGGAGPPPASRSLLPRRPGPGGRARPRPGPRRTW